MLVNILLFIFILFMYCVFKEFIIYYILKHHCKKYEGNCCVCGNDSCPHFKELIKTNSSWPHEIFNEDKEI